MDTTTRQIEDLSLEVVGHHHLIAAWLDTTLAAEMNRLKNCKPEELSAIQARIQMLDLFIKAPARLVAEERQKRQRILMEPYAVGD